MKRSNLVPANPADHAETSDLVISRVLRAPRTALWRAWTEPDLLKEWWCPRPWTTEVLAFDLRSGGAFHTYMRGPDGGTSDNPGCFLEIVPQARLVFTSMLTAQWRPNTPWLGFTGIITMADEGEGSRYEARVMHPDNATRERHEALGFFDGWNTCITQLDDFASTLR
ncbi:polyketide cyclase [Paraburkholderia acidicola]|uniref:Polyketide cyclase n=1 Tax=Paraburkholderia acidicola TaxID=1912599 RepID=A0A2A4EM73_9BURK|nr:polyketide cyclase [Paraburkholderia acidicola]